MTWLVAALLSAALFFSLVGGFMLWTENKLLKGTNTHMSAMLDRLTAVVPQLEAEVASLKAQLSPPPQTGTSDAELEPWVARLEALANPATIPAPPPAA